MKDVWLIYSDRISSYEELLDKKQFCANSSDDLQKLAIKKFKTNTGIAPQIINVSNEYVTSSKSFPEPVL